MACVANYDLCWISNDDIYFDLQYLESDGETPIDLTGATALMELRDSVTDASVVDTMNGGIINAANGQMRFTLTDTETAALLPRAQASRTLEYSVKLTYSDASKQTILTGKATLNQVATA